MFHYRIYQQSIDEKDLGLSLILAGLVKNNKIEAVDRAPNEF